jgi:DNA-binding NarL/FixJ family response regulator
MIRVLVVDDHEAIRSAVSRALANADGIEVVGTCASGRDAVLTAERMRPDVVVMDLSMPGMDGVEATRHILAGQPEVRVLIHTAGGNSRQLRDACDAGAAAVLIKSLDLSEVVSAVRSVAS